MDEPQKKAMPVFIKIEDYKDVIDVMELIKHKVDEANSILEKIKELKAQEEAELEEWKTNLQEVEKKIEYIDGTLFEPDTV